MLKLGFVALVSTITAFAVTAPACSSLENAYNCDQICDRYADCFDPNYDTDTCQSRCENNADDTDFADHAEDCQNCLEDRTCSGSFGCILECVGIVP